MCGRRPGAAAIPTWDARCCRAGLPDAGIEYRWERRLGGFRKAAPDSPDVFWENASFRGYAGYTRNPDFIQAMDELLVQAAGLRTTVMCSESVWWRCHRRIIADFAVLARHARVLHLAHDGRLAEHRPSAGARLRDDGLLVYDRAQPPPEPTMDL
ncbi:DUF488 domain-containing protein [Sinomonas terrae]|uniref:DUF488 domain-containing protein n=1 Tax=Sinomonas terrae TaxID=2908838 RepID=A0ABS9TY39_9MICC|nr:DUF488 domain-containing protein [Sinomonas terrae]MCH6469172.1 DUF488 domain-containing protein [Sinomonas terrae]